MSRQSHALYDGALKANKIGAFVLGGETFHIIKPGYDSQGRRQPRWTQFVHEDVPVYQVKMDVDLDVAMDRFETAFKASIGDDRALLTKALAGAKASHRARFMDGKTGVEPAPTATQDGVNTGRRYPA
ncbi:hypothetical protein MARCHEWKA_04870 [Brevundimonas phage vB_BpoS-Marchewka]|uniref:Uncharacterized protein n=1 Tax=Brevundimonas phage vB_BpoS-Marchewka TaxID=2948604 RepID=A0A9E7SRB5_9CAUD|nr:hypothetical protein MARCHEWKA_04870 [Brevundimonas phage vB_BpoS-Marchewka]